MNANDRRTCGPPNALEAALVANLSPEAITAMITFLRAGEGYHPRTEALSQALAEVEWFSQFLMNVIGVEEYNRLIEEIGL